LFCILYFVSFRYTARNLHLVQYWQDLNAVMPMPPWQDASWFPIRISALFTELLGLPPWPWLEIVLFLLGLTSFALRHRWDLVLAFTLPILFALLASAVINYPFKGRLIFFLIPGLCLALGEGLERVYLLLIKWPWLAYAAWIGLLLFFLSTP